MRGKCQIIYVGDSKSPGRPPRGGYTEHQHIGRFMTPIEVFWETFGFWICIIASGVFMYFVFGSPFEVNL